MCVLIYDYLNVCEISREINVRIIQLLTENVCVGGYFYINIAFFNLLERQGQVINNKRINCYYFLQS